MAGIRQLRVLRQAAPTAVSGKVVEPPRRRHLTPHEVDRLIATAGKLGRHGQRDATLILLAYRHGLREGEVVTLRRDAFDLRAGTVHVARLKGGVASTHPLRGVELRALKRLWREYDSPYAFSGERGTPLTTSGVRKIVARAAKAAKLGVRNAHALRHATGYKLAADGIDTRAIAGYLGHASLASTMRYTALSPARFKDFWRD
jgi:type 1 fimbriae regulatory protein FimE